MSQPNRHDPGLANGPTDKISKTKAKKSSSDHAVKKQEAASLIKQGKIHEAEDIYRTNNNRYIQPHHLRKTCDDLWNAGKAWRMHRAFQKIYRIKS